MANPIKTKQTPFTGQSVISPVNAWRLITNSVPYKPRVDYQSATVLSNYNDNPQASFVLMGGQTIFDIYCLNDIWSSSNGLNWTLITDKAPWLPRCGFSLISIPPSIDIPVNILSPLHLNITKKTNNSTLVLLGGQQYPSSALNAYLNDIWISFDLGYHWTQITSSAPWSIRVYPSVTLINDNTDQMLLTGGATHNTTTETILSDVWISAKGSFGSVWLLLTASAGFGPRAYHTSFSLNSNLFVAGGMISQSFGSLDSVDTNTVYSSSNLGLTWQSVDKIPLTTGHGIHGAPLVKSPLGDRVFSFCGIWGLQFEDKIMSYFDGTQWLIEPNSNPFPFLERATGSAAIFYNNYSQPYNYSIFIFGGISDSDIKGIGPTDIWAWSPGPPMPIISSNINIMVNNNPSLSVDITITSSYDGGLPIKKYLLTVNNKNNTYNNTFVCYPSPVSSMCHYSLSDLSVNNDYLLNVIALNDLGGSNGLDVPVTFSTQIRPVPSSSPTTNSPVSKASLTRIQGIQTFAYLSITLISLYFTIYFNQVQ